MKTTVEIPDALFRRAKAQAALPGIRLRDLMVRGLELALEMDVRPVQHKQTFPIIPGTAGRVVTSQDFREAFIDACN